jgi:DHA2 family multidrug resistance protein-like MFS transporter
LIPVSAHKKQAFDFPGFAFFTIGASCFVTLIMQGGEWGWTSSLSIAFFALGLISTWLLVRREKRSKRPFIDLSLFKHPIYKAVNISVFATQFVLMISIYRAVFFQDTMDWSPLKSGLVFCVTSLPVLFISPIGGWIADKSGAKIPVVLGFIFLIVSFFLAAFFVEDALWILLLVFLAFGVGVPLILTPSYSSAMASVPEVKAGTAFGVLATVRSLSSTLGVAIITAFAKQVQWYAFEKKIEGNPVTKVLESSLVENLSMGVQGSLESIPSEQRSFVVQYIKESQIRGFFVLHVALGCALILALGFVFVLYHRKASHHPPEAPAEGWD